MGLAEIEMLKIITGVTALGRAAPAHYLHVRYEPRPTIEQILGWKPQGAARINDLLARARVITLRSHVVATGTGTDQGLTMWCSQWDPGLSQLELELPVAAEDSGNHLEIDGEPIVLEPE